jgi:hypothetical protein
MAMFKVSYTLKDENKFLTDETAKFRYLQDAFDFMRRLLASTGLVGKPTIERI